MYMIFISDLIHVVVDLLRRCRFRQLLVDRVIATHATLALAPISMTVARYRRVPTTVFAVVMAKTIVQTHILKVRNVKVLVVALARFV